MDARYWAPILPIRADSQRTLPEGEAKQLCYFGTSSQASARVVTALLKKSS